MAKHSSISADALRARIQENARAYENREAAKSGAVQALKDAGYTLTSEKIFAGQRSCIFTAPTGVDITVIIA